MRESPIPAHNPARPVTATPHALSESESATRLRKFQILALLVELVRPRVAGGLDDDDAADVLALLVGLVDEQVGEGAQEVAGAELEDRFG